jgi:hypothetical protein
MFRKAHEENVKQAELEKKKALKEAAEAEKTKSAQLASKNVYILDYTCFTVLLNPQNFFMYVFYLLAGLESFKSKPASKTNIRENEIYK